MMINPLTHVKNVRTVYDRFYQKNVKEVQVQFLDEDPAWIPYDTLLCYVIIKYSKKTILIGMIYECGGKKTFI